MKQWYVLQVRTGEETKIKDYIKRDLPEVDVLAPLRLMKERKDGIWKERLMIVFQGYVFVKSIMTPEMYYKLSGIPGVITILRH